MPTPRGVLKGWKCSGTHTTILRECQRLIQRGRNLQAVTKIRTGPLLALQSGHPSLTIRRIPVGLKLSIRGSDGKQTLFIYTDQQDAVAANLGALWYRLYPTSQPQDVE